MVNERGRPRTFDVTNALDRALSVFWKHGFLNASLSELTSAMELNKPSLYAAFGDKESLYLRALDRYVEQRLSGHAAALNEEADGRGALDRFLRALAALYTDPGNPGGCFIINGAADLGGTALPKAVEDGLRTALQRNEAMLKARLARALADGQLPAGSKVDNLAAFFMSTVAGMGVLAKAGAKRKKLDAAIDIAMTAWQSPAKSSAPRKSSA